MSSAAEKLRAMDKAMPHAPTHIATWPLFWEYRNVLPQIVALVEAAENAEGWMVAVRENELETFLQVPLGEWPPVVSALTALDEALS